MEPHSNRGSIPRRLITRPSQPTVSKLARTMAALFRLKTRRATCPADKFDKLEECRLTVHLSRNTPTFLETFPELYEIWNILWIEEKFINARNSKYWTRLRNRTEKERRKTFKLVFSGETRILFTIRTMSQLFLIELTPCRRYYYTE